MDGDGGGGSTDQNPRGDTGASSVVPDDAPAVCGACGDPYDSVSEHDDGLLVNLQDNERYRRVCFEPAERDGEPVVRFYHHTHEQV
ncbi:MAG: hypothetical protein ABEI99_12795 [Halobaculum sp.]